MKILKTLKDIFQLKSGQLIIWPFLAKDEIFEFEKYDEKRQQLVFRETDGSLGAIIDISDLLNYPNLIDFTTRSKTNISMYLTEENVTRKASVEKTDRQKNYEPTTFHMEKSVKLVVQEFVFQQKRKGEKTSQESFINDAVVEKCKRLKLI